MKKTNDQDRTVPLDPNQLNALISNANSMNDSLRPHLALQNKISIYCNILNNIFPVIYRYAFLTLSIIYLWKHVIANNILDVISKLLPNGKLNWITLLIICSTIVLSSFVRRKWK